MDTGAARPATLFFIVERGKNAPSHLSCVVPERIHRQTLPLADALYAGVWSGQFRCLLAPAKQNHLALRISLASSCHGCSSHELRALPDVEGNATMRVVPRLRSCNPIRTSPVPFNPRNTLDASLPLKARNRGEYFRIF